MKHNNIPSEDYCPLEMDSLQDLTPPSTSDSSSVPELTTIRAGFPSPAEDFHGSALDLTKLLVKNPAATFYARVAGDSMTGDGIDDGDILVIDKSVEIYHRCIAVCFVDGEFTVKRVERHPDYALLVPSNPKYPKIKVTEDNKLIIWGVVRFVIKKV